MNILQFKSEDIKPTEVDMETAVFLNADVLGESHGSPFDAGVSEYHKGNYVVFEHDHYGDVVFVIEGELIFEDNASEKVHAKPGDMVYLPQKEGLTITIHTPEYAKIVWMAYPHWS